MKTECADYWLDCPLCGSRGTQQFGVDIPAIRERRTAITSSPIMFRTALIVIASLRRTSDWRA